MKKNVFKLLKQFYIRLETMAYLYYLPVISNVKSIIKNYYSNIRLSNYLINVVFEI